MAKGWQAKSQKDGVISRAYKPQRGRGHMHVTGTLSGKIQT